MSDTPTLNRRGFLKLSALAGASLVLGLRLPGEDVEAAADSLAVMNMAAPTAQFVPNAYLKIDPDGAVTLTIHRSEMGQGVNTSISMILAEELEVDWPNVQIVQAPADRIYGDQVTGGSVSIQNSYAVLRAAGAVGRTMLINAAAQSWGVDPTTCRAELGTVIRSDGATLSYGELVEVAAALPVPGRGEFELKDPADFRLIGTSHGNFDNAAFVDGSAQFCSDIKLPGMLVAAVLHCSVLGGEAASVDSSAAQAIEGVRHVVPIPNGVAVVADDTWTALQGRAALNVTWDEGHSANVSSAAMMAMFVNSIELVNDPATVEGVYQIPFLAHATMEPMTCIADVRADSCDVWAPTQDRQQAKSAARSLTKLPDESVTIHVPLIGGGFGRRLQVDYVREAVTISQAVGAPVKVMWLREEDMQHDYYHPLSVSYRSNALEGRFRPRTRNSAGYGVPIGPWRSVGEFTTAFASEIFVDEYAAALGRDPYDVRRELNAGHALLAVLDLAAEKSGWGSPLPDGWGRGIAVYSTFGVTHVADVVELSVAEDGTVRVHRVVCAVDCGRIINPDNVIAQMESGIIFALSAVLHGEITIEGGRVQQSNFHDYPILRLDETPQIEVYLVASEQAPKGIGEMGVPPVAPAVMNAIYDATGRRLRRIPIKPEDFRA